MDRSISLRLGQSGRSYLNQAFPCETVVLIPLLLESGRMVRVNLLIDAGLLEGIDQEADRRKLSRSKFMASAARDKIEAQR